MPAPLEKLAALQTEFAECEPRERLELLLDFAENLPPLPEQYRAERDAGMHRVPECQTPVFLWVELLDGRVRLHADVAPEAPTVKGFVGILVDAFDGAEPAEILATPADLLRHFGLVEALGMTRTRGLYAIHTRILREVRALQGPDAAQ
jgi:cysteine desulfuration protein SufE